VFEALNSSLRLHHHCISALLSLLAALLHFKYQIAAVFLSIQITTVTLRQLRWTLSVAGLVGQIIANVKNAWA